MESTDARMYHSARSEGPDCGALLELMVRPAWHAAAACRCAPAEIDWFPEHDHARAAKLVCATCPVRAQCLAWALEQGPKLVGVWGGTSARQRRRRMAAA